MRSPHSVLGVCVQSAKGTLNPVRRNLGPNRHDLPVSPTLPAWHFIPGGFCSGSQAAGPRPHG